MSSIDPAKCGKCWSCQYCEDIGTYSYEDSVSYMRKCTKSGHDYVDDCQRYCSDYVWDGKTPENSSSSSSSSSSSYASSYASYSGSDSPGCGKVILIIAAVLVAIVALAYIFTELDANRKRASESNDTRPGTSSVSTEQSTAVVKTNGNTLRMRSGPSTDDDVVTQIPNGATVTVLEKNEDGSWTKVSYKGKTGWCASKYLNES